MTDDEMEDVRLSEDDSIAIVELLSTVVASPGSLSEKRHMLSQGIMRLIDVDVCVWVVTFIDHATGALTPLVYVADGVDMEVFSEIQNGRIDHPELHCSPDEPALMPLLKPGAVITRTRQQLVSDEDWYSHPHVAVDRIERLNVDHCVYSIYVNDDHNCLSAVGMHRRPGSEPFGARERRILHVLSTEVWWLHAGFQPEQTDLDVFPAIPNRLKRTFYLLMQGRTRPEITRLLGLSRHTVNGYVKDTYKLFGVRSHSELLNRFMTGDGNDR